MPIQPGFNSAAHAARAAEAALARAGVRVVETHEMGALRTVAALFAEVWGRNDEGVPMPSEVLRSVVHAGGLVSAVHDLASGDLLGAAVLGLAEPGSCYSYLAATRPGEADRGLGFALKQHQRAWCLARDISQMRWTFDPLVSRNARFNLSKIGARASVYEEAFYGQMSDVVNGTDPADRLVAEWSLQSPSAVAAAEGTLPQSSVPSPEASTLGQGPDGEAAWVESGAERWCRVPTDVVALRRSDPGAASRWRSQVREWLSSSFAEGFVADGANNLGWYHLSSSTEGSS